MSQPITIVKMCKIIQKNPVQKCIKHEMPRTSWSQASKAGHCFPDTWGIDVIWLLPPPIFLSLTVTFHKKQNQMFNLFLAFKMKAVRRFSVIMSRVAQSYFLRYCNSIIIPVTSSGICSIFIQMRNEPFTSCVQ